MANLNLNRKQTGDRLTADEYNAIISNIKSLEGGYIKEVATSYNFTSSDVTGIYVPTESGSYGKSGDKSAVIDLEDYPFSTLFWDAEALIISAKNNPIPTGNFITVDQIGENIASLVDGKIPANELPLITESTLNLYNKTNYVENNGIVNGVHFTGEAQQGYISTATSVPAQANTTYTISKTAGYGTAAVFCYDSNDAYLGQATSVENIPNVKFTFTTLANTAGIQWNLHNNSANWENALNTQMLVLGTTLPTEYIPYQQSLISISGFPIKNADKEVYSTLQTYNKEEVDSMIPDIEYQTSKNLFNPNDPDVVIDHYISYTNGTTPANTNYNATGFIPVTGGLSYAFSFANQRAWYDANKVFISGQPAAGGNVLVAPANAAFARASVSKAAWETFQVEQGEAVTEYEPYGNTVVSINGATIASNGGSVTPTTYDANVAMPKRLYALVGQEFNVYYDTFNVLPEYGGGVPSFLFDVVVNSKVQMRYRSLQFTPTSTDVGEYPLTFNFLNSNGETVQTVTSTIEVVERTPIVSPKNLLIIGDSTWHNGGSTGTAVATLTLGEIITNIGGSTVTFFGQQQQPPFHNECRSGRTWSSFANGATTYKIFFSGVDPSFNPDDLRNATYSHGSSSNTARFVERWVINEDGTGWMAGYTDSGSFTPPTTFPTTMTLRNNTAASQGFPATLNVTNAQTISNFSVFKDNDGVGVLDINYYVETVLKKPVGTKIDVLVADLGINDTTSPSANIDGIINNAIALVQAFQSHNPNIKIILCYPKSKGADYFYTTRRQIRFTMQKLRKKLLENFDFTSTYPNVYISQSGMGMDRFYGYPVNTNTVSGGRLSGNGITFNSTNNDVHPSDYGNQQIGDAVSGCLIKILNM